MVRSLKERGKTLYLVTRSESWVNVYPVCYDAGRSRGQDSKPQARNSCGMNENTFHPMRSHRKCQTTFPIHCKLDLVGGRYIRARACTKAR